MKKTNYRMRLAFIFLMSQMGYPYIMQKEVIIFKVLKWF